MSTLEVTTTQLDTLRASQLKEAAETMDRVAGEFSMLSTSDDVTDPLGDLANSIRVVRESMRSAAE